MRNLTKIAAIIGMVSVMGVGSALADKMVDRQWRQANRIHQGVYSGELTRAEARNLYRQLRHIQQLRVRAWSDGRLTARERKIIAHRQDRVSHLIYRFKHNHRVRW
jgi:CRISPR/Cas system-associated endoribonuclease Cas2